MTKELNVAQLGVPALQ